jgi:EmrB/QacA subfamily drug resistance transporter
MPYGDLRLRPYVTAPQTPTVRPARSSVGLRSERGPILGSVMLSIALVAIDSTILATAVPAVVADLGGFTQFPWLFSAYLLAQAVTTPVYGKVADVVGRKPLMLFGVLVFVGGSVLSALAWSMSALIAFRAVQGIGAGAIMPAGTTIMGDIYSLAERAVAQGYIASVWAISAVVGPTLGGLFVDQLSWRWIFWVNVPLGGLACWMLARSFHEEPVERTRAPIDWWGAILLALSAGLLLLGLLEGGIRWAWDSPTSIVIFAAAAALALGAAVVETRAVDPVLPPWIFQRRVLNAATVGALVVGVVMMGVTSYVPLYAQRVLGTGAIVAGLALAALTIGWPIAASTAGRIYLRWGFRTTQLLGAGFGVAGCAVLLLVGPDSSVWLVAAGCLVLGLGLGYVASPGVIAAQTAVAWQQRGVATGANLFARSVGSAVGVAVFGAIANATVVHRLGSSRTEQVELEHLPVGVLDPALHAVFVAVAACALLLVVAALLMPSRVADTTGSEIATRE